MPAIITHDTFGQDIYPELHVVLGETRDEFEAFLLGNQGPDPLFYSVINPSLHEFNHLGSTMHSALPSELLAAFKQSLSVLSQDEYPIGRAYALGFLCHYTLDSSMHPLVFATEYSLCDAGIDGLDRTDSSEVHVTIETELDEMVLFTKRGKTIEVFSPAEEILKASDFTLTAIGKMYAFVAMTVYGLFIPARMFSVSVKNFRFATGFFYSPTGQRRSAISSIERLVRRHSFYRAMSHRAVKLTESQFDNHERAIWVNPFTDQTSTESFWDIYNRACVTAKRNIALFTSNEFGEKQARDLTGDNDFSGKPTTATIFTEDVTEERR